MLTPKKTILDAKGYECPLYNEDYIMKLDTNENIIGPSSKVVEALKNIEAKDIQFYPAYGELIESVSEFNNIEINQVLPTNGADEAINYIFDTFVESEDTVLTVTPTFAMPKVYAKSTGCTYKEIPYKEKWVFPIEEFLAEINDSVKLIIITTPNNPTGESIKHDDFIRIIEKAKNSYILIDETYANYTDKSYCELIKAYKNILITKSMSKDFAIAGLRLGYIISNEQNIDYIRRIISPYSVNVLATKAGVAALSDYKHFENVKSQVVESKKILIEGFKDLAVKIYSSDANFLCIDFAEKAEFVYKKLLKAGIKTKFFNNSNALQNHIRMTAPSPEQSKYLIEVLKSKDMLVFDIDGVLIDTRKSYRMAIKGTYEFFADKEIDFDTIQKAKNLGGLNNDWDLTEYLLKQSELDIDKKDIIDKFQELYFGNQGSGFIKNEELLIEKEKLEELSKYFDLAIFTGRPKEEALFALQSRGLDNLFAPVITMDDLPGDKQKPDPKGLNDIVKIANPIKCYYLGDTADDMTAAKNADSEINAIGILPPQDKSEELKDSLYQKGADSVLYKTEDLIEILKVNMESQEDEYAQS